MKNRSIWNVLAKNQVAAATSLALLLTAGATTAHAQLDPNNTNYTVNGALNVATGSTIVINTDTGTLTVNGGTAINGNTQTQTGAGAISVFDFSSISIATGVTVTVTGSKSLALLSTSTASVLSDIDVSGASGTITPTSPGSPVAGTGAVGGGSGGNGGTVTNTPATPGTSTLNGNGGGVVAAPDSTTYFQDGAGGGNGGAGGNGGTFNGGATGGNASGTSPKTTLVGGGGGGGGPDNDASAIQPVQAPGGGGGAGGGAVEIIAVGAVTVNSLTTNGGTGGGPDPTDPTSNGSQYGGGGAGGTLVVGGSSLTVNTGLTAEGGGVAANSSAGSGGGGAVSLIGTPSFVLGSTAAAGLGVMVDVAGGAAGGGAGGTGTAGNIEAQTVGVTADTGFTATFDPTTNSITNTAPSQTQSGSTPGISITFGNNVALNGGTLQFTAAGTFGNALELDGVQNMVDTQGFNNTISSAVTGAGELLKEGTGSLTLTNANTYQGGTEIDAGKLIVANNAALGSNVLIQNAGTLQTDNVNHTITVGVGLPSNTLSYNMTGGTLSININGAPGAASNDQVVVSGQAVLNGHLVINYNGPLIPAGTTSAPYTIVTTTGGVTAAGAGFTIPTVHAGALVLTGSGSIDPSGDDFDVSFTSSQGLFSSVAKLNPNQTQVATYLDRIDGAATGHLTNLINALDAVSINPTAFGAALNQLMPLNFAHFASTTAFNGSDFTIEQMDNYLAGHRSADGTFVGSAGGLDYSGLTLNDPNTAAGLQEIRSRLLAWNPAPSTGLISDSATSVLGGVDMKDTKAMRSYNTPPANLWNVFVAGDVQLAQDFSDNSAGSAHQDSTSGEFRLGADYAVTPHFIVGGLVNYVHTDGTLDNNNSGATIDSYAPGVYASYTENGWYANAISTYSFNSYTQSRDVALTGFTGHADSAPTGDQILGNLDGGYDFHVGPLTYGPTLGVKYVHLDINGYSETGLPGDDLVVNRDEADSLRSRIGGHVSYVMHEEGIDFIPHLDASYVHEFMDGSRGINSQIGGLGAGTFSVATPDPSRNSALVTLGLDAKLDSTFTIFSNYTVQAGQEDYFGQSFQLGLKVGF